LTPDPDRIFYVKRALDLGWSHEEIHRMTGIDPWFLDQIQQIVDLEKEVVGFVAATTQPRAASEAGFTPAQRAGGPGGATQLPPELMRRSKRYGFSDVR